MQIKGQEQLGHFGYCTNIHAGEAWPDLIRSLREHVPGIQREVAPDQPFGLGLRLGANAVSDLANQAAVEELQAFLQESNSYVFSVNGFPYGTFHAQAVKENVYAPDWSTPERLSYTNEIADILVQLLPDDGFGTVSTVPGTFKPWSEGRLSIIAESLLGHVIHLVELQRSTGKTIALALEPEPFCLLETIAETVDFFNDYLFSATAVKQVATATGLNNDASLAAIKQHCGVCYDVCHAAVEYEDAANSVRDLQEAGISIAKVQLSSALRVASVGPDIEQLLGGFNEPVYLHQVLQNKSGELQRYLDLPEALANSQQAQGSEWRVHFHVPVFLERLQHFDTTQFFLKDILALHRQSPITTHMEVETYTWDVLPEEYRNVGVGAAIAREMNWVLDELA